MDLFGIGPAGAARILCRRRRRGPVPRPQPLRVLDRHRTPGRLLRRADPTPAVAGREPTAEPRPAHRRDRPDPPRHRGPRLLPTQARPRPRPRWRPCAASSAGSPTRSTASSSPTPTRPTDRQVEAGPGGHSGASSQSSAADLSTPVIGSSDQPLPGPAATTLPADHDPCEDPRGLRLPSPTRRRAGAVKMERPTGRTTLTATSDVAHSRRPKPRP